jgi:hypothetical protein
LWLEPHKVQVKIGGDGCLLGGEVHLTFFSTILDLPVTRPALFSYFDLIIKLRLLFSR